MTPLLVLLGLALVLGLFLAATYNRLVRLRNLVEEAWAHIDVQLVRRHDLVPNLVETVKGYAGHERETLERVVQARSAAAVADRVPDRAQAEGLLTAALRQVFALAEAYPQLKADASFRELAKELAYLEEVISGARQTYNARVRDYDTAREVFPANLIAGMFGFAERAYFEIDDPDSREPVQVEF